MIKKGRTRYRTRDPDWGPRGGTRSHEFLTTGQRRPAKKDRPDCALARTRRNLQLYRKKGAASVGQTASWPVNNVAK